MPLHLVQVIENGISVCENSMGNIGDIHVTHLCHEWFEGFYHTGGVRQSGSTLSFSTSSRTLLYNADFSQPLATPLTDFIIALPAVRTITALDLNMNIRVCCVDTEAAEDRIT